MVLEVWVPAAHSALSPPHILAQVPSGQQVLPLRPKFTVYLWTPHFHPASCLRHSSDYCTVILFQINGLIQSSFLNNNLFYFLNTGCMKYKIFKCTEVFKLKVGPPAHHCIAASQFLCPENTTVTSSRISFVVGGASDPVPSFCLLRCEGDFL